jgi:hypothetical protein
LRLFSLLLIALTLPACGQRLAGTTYRAEVGRQVTDWFDRDAATTWKAGVEMRFDAGK